MCKRRVTDQPLPRRVFLRGQSGAALLGLALTAPTYAIDRIWNTNNGLWSTQASWSPVGWPSVTDHVYIGSTPATIDAISSMDVGGTVAGLDLLARAQLYTNGRSLTVNGLTRIDGDFVDGASARLNVTDGANAIDFRTDGLQILGAGSVYMNGGPTVGVDGAVSIGQDAYLLGSGLMNVAGAFANSGAIMVHEGGMTLNVTNGAAIDLDGGGNGRFTVNANEDLGASLSIVASAVSDPFDGQIFLGGGSLLSVSVGGSWALGPAGHIGFAWYQSSGHEATIQGAPLSIGGELHIEGSSNSLLVQCDTTFTPTALFTSSGFGDEGGSNVLQLNGESTIDGGQFDLSPGSRVQFADVTTIDGGNFTLDDGANVDFDGPTAVHGGSFTTFSTLLGDGTVDFNGPTEWSGTVVINGIARQQGAASVSGATVINADVFDMDGPTQHDWSIQHGLTINAGALDVGSNHVDGTINITGGAVAKLTVNLDGPGESWTAAGELNLGPLAGAAHIPVTRIAGSAIMVLGSLNVDTGRPRIGAATTLHNNAEVTINAATAELRLDSISVVQPAATFQGAGTLVNSASGDLTLASGVNTTGVGLTNQGLLRIGNQSGIAAVDRFDTTGTWQIQIGGPAAGAEHDRLIVSSGTAQLAGQLLVRLIDLGSGVFTPQVGDEFTILTSLGAVSGTFAASPRSFSQGHRFDWTVLYGSNDVTLRLEAIIDCPLGDIDENGDIDLQDLAILLANFGTGTGADWVDGDLDGDGDVDLQDLATLLSHFGSSCE